MAEPRKIAVRILVKIQKENAYSNIALSSELSEYELSPVDKAFVSALVYGVLDRKITLDYVLSGFMKTPLKKTAPYTLNVLRTALYQIMFMDKIPESAAVNEAVRIIKGSKESRNSGFVNGVLRSILRSETLLPEGKDASSLSIRYSCPLWIVESFIKDYGAETAEQLLIEALKAPPVTLRVNNIKTSTPDLKDRLEKEGIPSEIGDGENSLLLTKGIDVKNNHLFNEGLFHIQDLASQKAVSVLAPRPGERVLDMCAAPGGKSFTMAELMENKGEIISCDIYENRVGLIKSNAHRLGLDIIKPLVQDATEFNPQLGEFDCILCDVPCSGLGVIRRKPDIKYKEAEDLTLLSSIQLNILRNAVKYLKKGGRILYSTCTLRSEENEKLVISFREEYNSFVKVYEHTFMPHIDKTDGFYCALLRKE